MNWSTGVICAALLLAACDEKKPPVAEAPKAAVPVVVAPEIGAPPTGPDGPAGIVYPTFVISTAPVDITKGKEMFAAKGCIACHKIGAKGVEIGPNLSKIGGIRTERELIESILFPSNNIARDYDLHSFLMTDGSTVLGLVKARAAEGITITEVSGQVRFLAQESIASTTMLTTSLMPSGLDGTLSPQDLLDLVGYLRSLK